MDVDSLNDIYKDCHGLPNWFVYLTYILIIIILLIFLIIIIPTNFKLFNQWKKFEQWYYYLYFVV